MATKAEVKSQALELLGVKRLGQAAQSQDDTEIGNAYTEVYADLKDEGLATWASAAAVPDAITPHMTALVAFSRVDLYGVSNERYQRILIRANNAKREIRKIVHPDYESLDEPTDY